jgi:hypothetical protein
MHVNDRHHQGGQLREIVYLSRDQAASLCPAVVLGLTVKGLDPCLGQNCRGGALRLGKYRALISSAPARRKRREGGGRRGRRKRRRRKTWSSIDGAHPDSGPMLVFI